MEFLEFAKLLVATVRVLFKSNQNVAFETATMRGFYNDAAFKVWWTWYSFAGSKASHCRDTSPVLREL